MCKDNKSLLLWKNIKCIMHPQHSTIKQAFIFHCTLLFTLWGQRLTLTSKMEVMFGKTRYGSLLLRALARQKAVWARACGLIFGPPEADPYYIPLHYFTLLLLPTSFNYLCCQCSYGISQKGFFPLQIIRKIEIILYVFQKSKCFCLPLWNFIWDTILYDVQWAKNKKYMWT